MGTALFILLMVLVVHYPRRSGPARIKNENENYSPPVIDVTFNDRYIEEMMLDTGASYTVITEEMAQRFNVTRIGIKLPFQGVGGSVEWPLATVSSIEVGGVRREDVMVAISPEEKLLGQTFFGKLDVIIRNGVVEFRP